MSIFGSFNKVASRLDDDASQALHSGQSANQLRDALDGVRERIKDIEAKMNELEKVDGTIEQKKKAMREYNKLVKARTKLWNDTNSLTRALRAAH